PDAVVLIKPAETRTAFIRKRNNAASSQEGSPKESALDLRRCEISAQVCRSATGRADCTAIAPLRGGRALQGHHAQGLACPEAPLTCPPPGVPGGVRRRGGPGPRGPRHQSGVCTSSPAA